MGIEERLRLARDRSLLRIPQLELYDYQKKISDLILHNTVLRSGEEGNFEISRQSGKSAAFVLTECFLSTINDLLYNEVIQVGFFAPKEQQVKTSFDKLKDWLPLFANAFKMRFLERNSNTLVMARRGKNIIGRPIWRKACIFYAYTLGEGAHVESKTLHRAYVDEAQDIEDFKVNKEVVPMLSATSGSLYRIGVAGYHNCDFKKAIDGGKHAVVCDVDMVIRQRQEMFEHTGDERHLLYERFYKKMVEDIGGDDTDFVKTQFRLIWVVEKGNMLTRQKLEKCRKKFLCVDSPYIVVGVDLAKKSDSTVMTASTELGQRLCARELRGQDYVDQYPAICSFCSWLEDHGYKITRVRVDTTGSTGDAAGEALRAHPDCKWSVEFFYFAPQNKHNLYMQFLNLIEMGAALAEERQTDEGQRRFEYWEGDPCREQFEYQLLQMEKEYKGAEGNLLSCHHPNTPGAKDDHPDSTAMSVFLPQEQESRVGFVIF